MCKACVTFDDFLDGDMGTIRGRFTFPNMTHVTITKLGIGCVTPSPRPAGALPLRLAKALALMPSLVFGGSLMLAPARIAIWRLER